MTKEQLEGSVGWIMKCLGELMQVHTSSIPVRLEVRAPSDLEATAAYQALGVMHEQLGVEYRRADSFFDNRLGARALGLFLSSAPMFHEGGTVYVRPDPQGPKEPI